MPLLTHENAIKQYWEEDKDQYPDVDFERFERICKSPFQAIRIWIRDKAFPIIKLKYFGTIRVRKSTIIGKLHDNERWWANKTISEELYLNTKKQLSEYLDKIEREEAKEVDTTEIIDDEED